MTCPCYTAEHRESTKMCHLICLPASQTLRILWIRACFPLLMSQHGRDLCRFRSAQKRKARGKRLNSSILSPRAKARAQNCGKNLLVLESRNLKQIKHLPLIVPQSRAMIVRKTWCKAWCTGRPRNRNWKANRFVTERVAEKTLSPKELSGQSTGTARTAMRPNRTIKRS